MKPCSNCGRENWDDAISCRTCGTQFVDTSADTKPQEPRPSEIASPRNILTDMALGDLKARRLLLYLGLVVLAVAFALFLSRDGPTGNALGIVVLATGCSNGEQVVTFRPDPTNAEITYAGLVSASDDGKTQPMTVRSFGQLLPVPSGKETNYTLHFVALPKPGASMGGRPLAYTPGSYTVAYTPVESARGLGATSGGCAIAGSESPSAR